MSLPENHYECIQGSGDWLQARSGCVTASRVADAISFLTRKSGDKGPGDETAARYRYKLDMVSELLSGHSVEHFVSDAMERGSELEPLARTEYEYQMGVAVEQVGLILHPRIKRFAASPDGCIGDDGLVEFKCPLISTHLEYIIGGVIPKDYRTQMVAQLACCYPLRSYNDFVSYCPDLPAEYQMFRVRMERDAAIDAQIMDMETKVETFIAEVEEMLAKIKEYRVAPADDRLEQQLRRSIHAVKRGKPQPIVTDLERQLRDEVVL